MKSGLWLPLRSQNLRKYRAKFPKAPSAGGLESRGWGHILLMHPNPLTYGTPGPVGFVSLLGALATWTGRGLGIPASSPAVLRMGLGCAHSRNGWENLRFSAGERCPFSLTA